jgi:uncharacterized surface protein with fasciclin (FAS1) repeats
MRLNPLTIAATALLAAAALSPVAVAQTVTPAPAAATMAPATAPAPATSAKVVPHGDIIETLRFSGQFTTLLKGVDATNLTAVLKTYPNLTLFAPTDVAFAAMPPAELSAMMANKTGLQKVLTHHIINARVDASKIKGARGPVSSVANDKIMLDGSGEVLKADNAAIVQADVMASNGIVHVVDHVMTALPPEPPPAAPTAGQ